MALSRLPLPMQLRLLRWGYRFGKGRHRLRRWAEAHPQIAVGADWHRRAWWGMAAGECMREHLYFQRTHADALALVDDPDLTALHAAMARGGVILVSAHLGPPRTLMNWLIHQNLPLMIWANPIGIPKWQTDSTRVIFANPLDRQQRSQIMVQSALHLRSGGVLFGTADIPTAAKPIEFDRLGRRWRFSGGLPALARRMDVPVFMMLGIWRGQSRRVRIHCSSLPAPPASLSEDAWVLQWLEQYWSTMEPIVRHEPENLRFLRHLYTSQKRPEF